MNFSYHSEQWLPRPVHVVFAFFADPDNLPRLMPAWQKARIEHASIVPAPALAGSTDKAAGMGSRITLSFLPFPLSPFRVSWEAEIADFVWNSHFCDRQLRGPFTAWNHCHRLRPIDREGIDVTLVVDQVDYEMPLGTFGKVAHGLFLRRQIERTFAFRQAEISRIFKSAASEELKNL